jgi:hypothetical protein
MSRKQLLVAVVAIGCGLWGAVEAQDSDNGDGGELEVQQPANLSAADKVAGARQIVARATRLSERVTNLLNEARRDADMIRITCLNDKLTQINANLRNAEGRLTTLIDAVDPGLQDHEYTVIGVLGQKFTTLDQEASQCVGQEVYETGSSTNSTKINPGQAGGNENASNPPQPPPPVVIGAIPPARSPNT